MRESPVGLVRQTLMALGQLPEGGINTTIPTTQVIRFGSYGKYMKR